MLSNKVCSLRPKEEKYTFSAIFEINKHAQILKQWFGRTVIKSDERFSYEEAQYIIENKKQIIPKEISISKKEKEVSKEIKDAIISLYKLSKIIRKERMNSGAISFDKVEVKFQLDKKNNPKGLFFKKSKESNKLIEEFMLLANKKVAEFINNKKPKKTFIYRVHDSPDLQKLQALKKISKQFGYDLNISNSTQINSSLNNILKEVSGKKEQNLIDTLAIRSMSKAEYTTENIGHYGLAFDNYSHFTSPIRRYPDVMAHRLLQDYLENKPSKDSVIYKEKCKHSSYMENIATKAERESIKYMQIKYMQDYENNIFEGVISGVTEWGIYVEILENKCEGMIRIRDIKEDYFTFDPELYALVGDKTRKKYQLGDIIKIKVKKADLIKRQLDFILN
jgi:VacB/RNase II family 3'-5' exoribonuclease